MSDRIEKTVDLRAPIERVWRAVTNHEEFGQWFKVRLDQPFEAGGVSTGNITYPGYEHLPWEARVLTLDEPRLFAFDWPHLTDNTTPGAPVIGWTRVEFRLEPISDGTRLTITESGFDKLPAEHREKAYRGNEGGWEEQTRNIKAHVES